MKSLNVDVFCFDGFKFIGTKTVSIKIEDKTVEVAVPYAIIGNRNGIIVTVGNSSEEVSTMMLENISNGDDRTIKTICKRYATKIATDSLEIKCILRQV